MLYLVKKPLPQYKTIRFNKGKLQCRLIATCRDLSIELTILKRNLFFLVFKTGNIKYFGQLCLITRDKTLIFIVT